MDRNELYDTMSYLYDIAMENAPSNDVRKFNKSSNKIVNNYANKVIRLSKRINSLLKRIINTFSSVESLTDGSIRTSRITKSFPNDEKITSEISEIINSIKEFKDVISDTSSALSGVGYINANSFRVRTFGVYDFPDIAASATEYAFKQIQFRDLYELPENAKNISKMGKRISNKLYKITHSKDNTHDYTNAMSGISHIVQGVDELMQEFGSIVIRVPFTDWK